MTARKSYDRPLTLSTRRRPQTARATPKQPAVYYTYDAHRDLVEVPYQPRTPQTASQAAAVPVVGDGQRQLALGGR